MVDKLKSFSKVVVACYVIQAILSMMVKKLELEFEFVLFDCKMNFIFIMECGCDIIDEVYKVFRYSSRFKEFVFEVRGVIEGEFNIGIIFIIVSNLLYCILFQFLSVYFKFKLNVWEIMILYIIDQL